MEPEKSQVFLLLVTTVKRTSDEKTGVLFLSLRTPVSGSSFGSGDGGVPLKFRFTCLLRKELEGRNVLLLH